MLLFFPLQSPADDLVWSSAGVWEGNAIDEIVFDETGPYSKSELYDVIKFRPGDAYQARLIREAVSALYETKQFKSVWVTIKPLEAKGIVLEIHWVKNLLLKSLHFSGNRILSKKQLLKTMSVKKGDWFSRRAFEKGMADIETLYRNKGYFQAKVTWGMILSSGKNAGVDAMLTIKEGARTKIRSVSFSGKKVFSPWRLRLQIYSNKGEYYLLSELKEDIHRLVQFYEEAGYFRVVIGPTGVSFHEKTNEVDISITVEPSEHLKVIFEGGELLDRKVLESLLLFKKERSLEPGVLEASARQVKQFYLREGFPFPTVTPRIKSVPEEDRVEAYFMIDSGPRSRIKKIRFSGHYAFLSQRLLQQMSLSESGRFQKSYYSDEELEAAATALTLFYREEGFKNVTVTPEVAFYDAGSQVDLLFKIDEGARTRIVSIDFEGNHALTEAQLETALKFSRQHPFTREIVRQGRRALLSEYARRGYLKADVSPELHFSLDETDVTLRYHITEGPQTFFGDVSLTGNETSQDDLILRELKMKPGEPYNPETVLESQKHIYQTGLFSSVRFDPVTQGPDPNVSNEGGDEGVFSDRQDLKLTVIEKSRIALDFGIGYGDRERLRGSLGLSHHNLGGAGHSLAGRMERSRVEERYSLLHRKPWFFDESLTARTTASYFQEQEVAFNLETFSLVTGVEKNFTDRLTGALLYQIERKKTTNVPEQAELTAEDDATYTIGSLNPSFIYDTRDDPFNPRSGSVTSLVFRNAAQMLASNIQMVKATFQRRSYHALSKKLIFAFSGRFGFAERFGETENIPIPERFFLGGRNTVRGYDEDKLGVDGLTMLAPPGQLQSSARVPVGGNAMLVLNEELRYAFPKSFGLVFFLDHGNVWRRYQDVRFSEIKSTVGLGIRYNTPIGPFRLDWGYKLDREDYESSSAFHFTLGHAF